jgi:hypothetical protein
MSPLDVFESVAAAAAFAFGMEMPVAAVAERLEPLTAPAVWEMEAAVDVRTTAPPETACPRPRIPESAMRLRVPVELSASFVASAVPDRR